MSLPTSLTTDENQKARSRDDGGMSLAEVSLALKSHLLAPRSEPDIVGGKLRFRAQRPRAGGMSKDILPFPLSAYPTAAEISLLLETGRAQLAQAEGSEPSLDASTFRKLAWKHEHFLVIYAALVAYKSG